MNILLTTHLYMTPGRPGLAPDAGALHCFAREWVKMGHSVTVLHAYMHNYMGAGRLKLLAPMLRLERDELEGVNILRAEMRLVKAIDFIRRAFMTVAAFKFRSALKGSPLPDIILSHFPVITAGLPESLPYKCPRIAVLHTTDLLRPKKKRLWKKYGALGFRSPRIRDDFYSRKGIKKPGFIAYSGAPVMPGGLPERANDGVLKVIYAGKLIARKQVDLIINALAKLPKSVAWRLTIVGDGPERGQIEALIAARDLGGRAALTGSLPHDQAMMRMAEHDVFAMVSTGETFGLVYLEAMALGLITIGTRGEGIDGVIKYGFNGFLAEPGDADDLAVLFGEIAAMSQPEREVLTSRAVETARHMSAENMAREYLNNALKLTGQG
jgi:glycosyltransferase involved in cell wall biosynthesis